MSGSMGYLLDNHDLPSLLQADGFQPLPIALRHGLRAGAYSQPHRDPQLASFPCRKLW